MLKDITLGQYFPGNSVLHRLDPRVKLILTTLFITALFLANSAISYALMLVFVIFIIAVSTISSKLIYKSVKPLFFIILFTTVLNIFYIQGDPLVSFHILSFNLIISKQGLINAVFMILRIILLIIGTSLLTYTTSPILLTDGIERLLEPLKKIKVPVHEFAMMMTIALRFIPTLIEETDKIINAQKARGADFESGGLLKRAKALIPVLVPLFVSAFRRADELAIAMECRCYRGGEGRTRMKQYAMILADYMSFVIMILIFILILVFNNIKIFGV